MRLRGWGTIEEPHVIRKNSKRAAVSGYSALRREFFYTPLHCEVRTFLFRENRSQHGAIAHVDISDMSFRKGYILGSTWTFIALKCFPLKLSLYLFPWPKFLAFYLNSSPLSILEKSFVQQMNGSLPDGVDKMICSCTHCGSVRNNSWLNLWRKKLLVMMGTSSCLKSEYHVSLFE